MTEYAIDIVNVTKRFAEHTAVRDLSLRVPKGSVYGLLGPNGAGKTTTIRMILNIIAPDSGAIHIFGRPSNDRKITERIGYLPEERGLYQKMQVRRVLKFLAELKGVRGRRGRQAHRRVAGAPLAQDPREGLGIGEDRRALARHAAEGAVHRHAPARPGSRDPRRAVQRPRPDQRAGAQGHRRRAQEAREDRDLQHAPDGQRRAAVRFGVHHRARREGARWRR